MVSEIDFLYMNRSQYVRSGILNRFANSDPPVNPLTVIQNPRFSICNASNNLLFQMASGGTVNMWNQVDDRTYTVGFSVRSERYSRDHLAYIVTQQWPGTNLFQNDVSGNGNWEVVSVTC